ncbi:MAG TPA: hypothetical protein VFH27_05120, partial [Longimicrobiaceae bacterium]|nr:hypothetical protein [Longimicrobiaceae bacterium]
VAEIRKGNQAVLAALADAIASGNVPPVPRGGIGGEALHFGRVSSSASASSLHSADPFLPAPDDLPPGIDAVALRAWLTLLAQVPVMKLTEPVGEDRQPELENLQNQYVLPSASSSSAVPGFPGLSFQRTPNAGGGDCLYYALAGKNLTPEEIGAYRQSVASDTETAESTEAREMMNAQHVAAALTQSGVPGAMKLVAGRHRIPNQLYAGLQKVGGIYAGEDELSAWCRAEKKVAAVFYHHDSSISVFDIGGNRHDFPTGPTTRVTVARERFDHADLALYKTADHWERITAVSQAS